MIRSNVAQGQDRCAYATQNKTLIALFRAKETKHIIFSMQNSMQQNENYFMEKNEKVNRSNNCIFWCILNERNNKKWKKHQIAWRFTMGLCSSHSYDSLIIAFFTVVKSYFMQRMRESNTNTYCRRIWLCTTKSIHAYQVSGTKNE